MGQKGEALIAKRPFYAPIFFDSRMGLSPMLIGESENGLTDRPYCLARGQPFSDNQLEPPRSQSRLHT